MICLRPSYQKDSFHLNLIKGYSHTWAQSSDHDSDDKTQTDKNPPEDKLQDALEGMIERAGIKLYTEQKPKVRNVVYEFVNVWRVALSRDGSAQVAPFKVHLKHDAVPRRAKIYGRSQELHAEACKTFGRNGFCL